MIPSTNRQVVVVLALLVGLVAGVFLARTCESTRVAIPLALMLNAIRFSYISFGSAGSVAMRSP